MKLVTSWDDGSMLDFRMAELLRKYELPGIFYIPSNCEILPIDIVKIRDMGFEIGAHTVSHPQTIYLLSDQEQYDEIRLNKEWLEGILGTKVTKFCYPRGRYNDVTIAMLKKLGFEEARSTLVLSTDIPEDNFKTRTTIHAFQNRPEYKNFPWHEIAKKMFDSAKSKDGYYHIWGHSHEVDIYNEWDNLENVFKYIWESNLRSRSHK